MSEKASDAARDSKTGDSAPTRAAPRATQPTKKSAAKKSSSATRTDKGRVREVPASSNSKGSSSKVAAERPLSAAEYARTTAGSAASTAVMPAVKDDPTPPALPEPAGAGSTTRRASLHLVRVEPWSVTRLAFAISVAMMIVGVVAVSIFWLVLDLTGVWGQVNDSITSILSDDSSSFDVTDYLGFWRMVGLTLVLSAINVILMTALATIGAHLYNLAAQLLGGLEVTFAEDD